MKTEQSSPFIQAWQPAHLTTPTPKSVLTSAQVLARWLVLVWDRIGGEGNELLREALPGSPQIKADFNWPLSMDVDDQLRELVSSGWLEQCHWCPDLTMARYVFPGAPRDTKLPGETVGFYAAGYFYRPVQSCVAYEAFVKEWRYLLKTLPWSSKIGPGDRVRLTSQFLASTGQQRTAEARRIWEVMACSCSSCKGYLVAVDERRDSASELERYAADPEYCAHLKAHPWRHINARNLRVVD